MNEKELIVNLVHTDDDAHYVFNVFKDNHKKGKIGFKKMRIRNLLSSKSQIDELLNAVKDLTPVRELNLLLQEFAANTKTYSHLQQYLMIKSWFPDFVSDNYDVIIHNVEQKRAPFTGLSSYQTVEEAEGFYLSRYDEVYVQNLETIYQDVVKLFDSELQGRGRYLNALQGASLLDLDRLLGHAGTDGDLDIDIRQQFFSDYKESPTDPIVVNGEKIAQRELTKLGLYSAFLEVGEYPEEVRPKLLQELQRAYFNYNLQINGVMSSYFIFEMRTTLEEAQQKQLLLQKELKSTLQQVLELEQKNKREKKQDETRMKEIKELKTIIAEQNKKLLEHEEIREAGQEELDRLAQLSKREAAHLKNQLEMYENLATGYKWMLARDFSAYEIVVVYNSPLLYAKHIYHELLFMDIANALKEPFKAKKVLVQLVGLTGKQKKQMEKLAQAEKIELVFLESVDERDLIMDIACHLKESEEILHESA